MIAVFLRVHWTEHLCIHLTYSLNESLKHGRQEATAFGSILAYGLDQQRIGWPWHHPQIECYLIGVRLLKSVV